MAKEQEYLKFLLCNTHVCNLDHRTCDSWLTLYKNLLEGSPGTGNDALAQSNLIQNRFSYGYHNQNYIG